MTQHKKPKSSKLDDRTLPLHRVKNSNPNLSPPPPHSSHATPDTDENENPKENVLRIKAGSFSLELEGDPTFINSAYESMRPHILSRLREAALEAQPTPPPNPTTPPAPTPEPAPQTPKNEENYHNGFIWVYVCHPLYNKVHVVSREALQVSTSARYIDPERVHKIYVQRNGLSKLETLIGDSKTLWSELTSEGKKRLKSAQISS